jgi:hypothetical protein
LTSTPDRRAVETETILENFLRQFAHGHAEVLPGAERVDKLHIDHLGALLPCIRDDTFGRLLVLLRHNVE